MGWNYSKCVAILWLITIVCTSLMQKWWKMEKAKVGTRQYLHSRICSVLHVYNQWFIPTLHQVLETNPRQRWIHWWYRSPPKDAASGRWEFCGEKNNNFCFKFCTLCAKFLHIFLWLIYSPAIFFTHWTHPENTTKTVNKIIYLYLVGKGCGVKG